MNGQQNVFYDPRTRNRLKMVEPRGHDMALFEDLDAPVITHIICRTMAVDMYPRSYEVQNVGRF